jgi:hypothetical protein
MATEMPPTRYRVVERGRRLEVIDSWAGGRPNRAPAPSATRFTSSTTAPARRIAAAVAGGTRDARGQLILTTASWYDARGPRRVVLDGVAQTWLGNGLAALVVAVVLLWVLGGLAVAAMPAVVAVALVLSGKATITRWIDRLAAG